MKKDSRIYAFSKHAAFGMAVSGGLISAACIGGLPSANCGAIANVYLQGIQTFGSAGFCGIAILGGIEPTARSEHTSHKTDVIMASCLLAVGGVALLLGLLLASVGLPHAVHACWPR